MITTKKEEKEGSSKLMHKFTKYAVVLETAFILSTSPSSFGFIKNKDNNIVMAQVFKEKEDMTEDVKEATNRILNYLKTGDNAELEAFRNIARKYPISYKEGSKSARFTLYFIKSLEEYAQNDPGLKEFLDVYRKKGSLNPILFAKDLERLYYEAKREEAEKQYGSEVCNKFINLVTWRLASYASDVTAEAFTKGEIDSAVAELSRIGEVSPLGKPITEYERFELLYDEMLRKKMPKEGEELWNLFEAVVKKPRIRDFLFEIKSCVEGGAAKKSEFENKYGTDFVAKVTELFQSKIPTTSKRVATPSDLVSLFEDGRFVEFLENTNLLSSPIGQVREKDSARVQAFQMIFNNHLLKDKGFLDYISSSKAYKKAFKKGIKEDGDNASAATAISAVRSFLIDRANEPEFVGKLCDARINPEELKKVKKTVLDALSLKALMIYLGIEEKIPSLKEQEEGLSKMLSAFYEKNMRAWVGEKEKEGLVIRDLFHLVSYVSDVVRKGQVKSLDKKWLDSQLEHFWKNGYIRISPSFKPSEISESLLSGSNIGEALDKLIIGKEPLSTRTTGPENEVRVRALEFFLWRFTKDIDSYISDEKFGDFVKELKKTKIILNGKFEGEEAKAVEIIQNFLWSYAKADDTFSDALNAIGITIEDLKQTNTFDEKTAKALAAYISIKKGTWASEQAGLAEKKEKKEEEKPTLGGKEMPKPKTERKDIVW